MKPHRWLLVIALWAGLVVGGHVSDLLSRWFPWFFRLPEAQQNFLLIGVPLLLSAAAWIGTRAWTASRHGANYWRRRQQAAAAQRARIAPAPKMGLVDAMGVEKEAYAQIHDIVGRMTKARVSYIANAKTLDSHIAAAKANPSKGRHSQVMGKLARILDDHSKNIADDTRDFRRAVQLLSDSWSSRMYWHDKRGSASDILELQTTDKTRDLMAVNRKATETYTALRNNLDTFVGYTTRLDESVERQKKLWDNLLVAFAEFDRVCESVMFFHAQQTSRWRRLRRALRRPFRRKR